MREEIPVARHPLDFDTLEKGTLIDGEVLYAALECQPDHPHYGLKLVNLCERIESETAIICKIDQERIRLLTDEEACEYTFRMHRRHMRGLGRQIRRRTNIDYNMLTDEQRRMAEFQQRVMVASTQAARQAYRKEMRLLSATSK